MPYNTTFLSGTHDPFFSPLPLFSLSLSSHRLHHQHHYHHHHRTPPVPLNMDGDRLEEQDPFTINTLNTSHHHHPALFRPLPAFQSPPTPITPVRFAIPTIMDPNAPTVIDARDVPADEQELGASQPRFERGRGPSPEAGPSNPRRHHHHHHHIRQPQTPPSTFSWADALPLNPPVRNVRAYTNEASFDALNHLPPSYRRTLRKKLDALKREDVNDRVARDEDLRNVRGGLARHVDPMAGARVLVEIERIDGKALMEKVAHCTCSQSFFRVFPSSSSCPRRSPHPPHHPRAPLRSSGGAVRRGVVKSPASTLAHFRK